MDEWAIISYVESCINQLCEKFKQNQDYFISFKEQDLVAYFYHLICINHFFLEEIDYVRSNGDKIKTKLIDTQAPTLQKINNKIGSFDITILNPNQDNDDKDNLVAIEFKRIISLSRKKVLAIKLDIDKISNEYNEVKWGYILVFNSGTKKFTESFKDEIVQYNKNEHNKIFFTEGGNGL